MDEKRFEEIFGAENLARFRSQQDILADYRTLCAQLDDLNEQARQVFHVDLSLADILVAACSGVITGGVNGLFKSVVPKKGPLKHVHKTRRTAVDYQVPKPAGMKGTVQYLHRQIGPGHDIGRFKEALDLISGKTQDFPLWGKQASDWTGGVLHPGNMRIDNFLAMNGFRIPADPKAELMNHLLIDFFTKTSLPLPFTSYIADSGPQLAKLMLHMYNHGLNLKNAVGNTTAVLLLQIITHGYSFLFKALPASHLIETTTTQGVATAVQALFGEYGAYIHSNPFHVLQMIAHGSSFLVDTLITTGSQNYAGLFSLNYGSLLLFAKHAVQYILKVKDDYRQICAQIARTNEAMDVLNGEWYAHFRANLLEVASRDGFAETFDPQAIEKRHARTGEIVDRLDSLAERRRRLLAARKKEE